MSNKIEKFFDIDTEKEKLKNLKSKYIKDFSFFKSYKEVMDFTPKSVWDINSRTKEIKEIFEDDVEKHSCKRTDDGYAVSIKQNYSVFNPLLGIQILNIYSKVGDSVLDPFAGRDRALITNFMSRNYTGFEVSKTTFDKTNEKINKWKYFDKNYTINLINSDGVSMKELTEKFDFCYTCPPYWFKEKYESCENQLSDIPPSKEILWLEKLNILGTNLYRLLADNAFCVIIVADIRHEKKLIPLHSHFIDAMLKNNFTLKDLIINRTAPMNVSGINGYLRNKIMMKSHEYLLIFQKTLDKSSLIS